MKLHKYPHFHVTGQVSIFEHGSTRPDFVILAGGYISYEEEAYGGLIRDAKRKLERLGVPADRMAELHFDDVEITQRTAKCAIGVKQPFGERVEAFRDDACRTTKRPTLIRQRRLIPYSQSDMLEIYGPKVAAPAPVQADAEAVAA